MEKMTNVKALKAIKAGWAEMPADVAEKVDAMIASFEKKNANRKPSAKQAENEVLKSVIEDALSTADAGMTVSALIKTVPALNGFSNQKVTALLKQMIDAGIVVKTIDKKVALFTLAVTE